MITFSWLDANSILAGDLPAINELLQQLTQTPVIVTEHTLAEILTMAKIGVARHGAQLIGVGCLYVMQLPSVRLARIEDVVVTEAYRGQGVGRGLMERFIERARHEKCQKIMLTSNVRREVANQLYQDLGFEKYETNTYRMML